LNIGTEILLVDELWLDAHLLEQMSDQLTIAGVQHSCDKVASVKRDAIQGYKRCSSHFKMFAFQKWHHEVKVEERLEVIWCTLLVDTAGVRVKKKKKKLVIRTKRDR
jgi:hypothetical protein